MIRTESRKIWRKLIRSTDYDLFLLQFCSVLCSRLSFIDGSKSAKTILSFIFFARLRENVFLSFFSTFINHRITIYAGVLLRSLLIVPPREKNVLFANLKSTRILTTLSFQRKPKRRAEKAAEVIYVNQTPFMVFQSYLI